MCVYCQPQYIQAHFILATIVLDKQVTVDRESPDQVLKFEYKGTTTYECINGKSRFDLVDFPELLAISWPDH